MVRNVFRYFETRLAGNHECDGQMDGQTEWPLATVRRVLKCNCVFSKLGAILGQFPVIFMEVIHTRRVDYFKSGV